MATLSPDHIRNVFKTYCELMTAADADSIAALYAEDATVEDPIGTPLLKGRDAIHQFYKQNVGGVTLELEGNVRVAGSEGAAPLLAKTKSEPPMVIEIIDVMTFNDDGLITSMRAYWGESNMRPLGS